MVDPVKITIGDKDRFLIFDMNTMFNFENQTGKNILQQNIWAKPNIRDPKKPIPIISATDFRALLWACLLRDDPDLTIEQVGSWVDNSNMVVVTDLLLEIYNKGIKTPDKGDNNKKKVIQVL